MIRDLDETIAAVPRGERGELRVRRCTFRGSAPYTDVRHFFPDEKTGELRPGKGVTIKDGELRDVVQALLKLASSREQPRPRATNGRQQQFREALDRAPPAPAASEAELEEDRRLF